MDVPTTLIFGGPFQATLYHWHYHRLGNITGTKITEAKLNSRMGSMNMTKADLQFRIRNMTYTNMTEAKFQSRAKDLRALLRLGRESGKNCNITYGELSAGITTGRGCSAWGDLVQYLQDMFFQILEYIFTNKPP